MAENEIINIEIIQNNKKQQNAPNMTEKQPQSQIGQIDTSQNQQQQDPISIQQPKNHQCIFEVRCNVVLYRGQIMIPFEKHQDRLQRMKLMVFNKDNNFDPQNTEFPAYICVEPMSQAKNLFQFNIALIQDINKQFIQDGKMTITILDEEFNQLSFSTNPSRCLGQLLINQAIPESLGLLLSNIEKCIKVRKDENSNTQKPLQDSQSILNIKQINDGMMKRQMELLQLEQNRPQISVAPLLTQNMLQPQEKVLEQQSQIPNTFKVNRGAIANFSETVFPKKRRLDILDQLPDGQFNIYQDDDEEESDLEERKQAQLKEQEKYTKQIQLVSVFPNLLEIVPDNCLLKIMEFLNQKQIFQTRLICKKMANIFWMSLRSLSLSQYSEIPYSDFRNLFVQTIKLEKVNFGRLSLVYQKDLESSICSNHKSLIYIDISNYARLSDNILRKIYIECKQLKVLKINYHSSLTNTGLDMMVQHIKNLEELSIQSSQTYPDKNDKIQDKSVFKCMIRNPSIVYLNSYYSTLNFFTFLQELKISSKEEDLQAKSIFERVTTLQFQFIVVKQKSDFNKIFSLRHFRNLKKFKIGDIILDGARFQNSDNLLNLSMFNELTQNCKQTLLSVNFGYWCDDRVVDVIGNNCQNLKSISICSDNVRDVSMSVVFQKCTHLQSVDVKNCTQINGQSFQNMNSQRIKRIDVKFDESRYQYLIFTISALIPDRVVLVKNHMKSKYLL